MNHFSKEKTTLKQKLFANMFLLALLLLLLFLAGMFLLGGYTNTKARLFETLDFQTDVFSRQVASHYSNLAVMGIQLSEQSAECIDSYLEENNTDFDSLRDSQTHITGIQDALISQLTQKLMETDCTGAFILLETQINSGIDNADLSRSGLYLQRNSLDPNDTRILLYRGLADVGKSHNAMPHRKWRLEFSTNDFPNYEELTAAASLPLETAYRLTDVVTLPGTNERVMLLTIPVFGESGRLYGLCGFEISESYFKHIFAQPSELDRVIFCLNKGETGLSDAQDCLSAGIINGYYLAPRGQFKISSFGKGLFTCSSDETAYVGIITNTVLCPGGETFSLSTLIPRQDYDRLARIDALKITILVSVFVTFAAACCLYFTRRYLRPLRQSLDRIRSKNYADQTTHIAEIDDLFAFLADQDRQNELALSKAQMEIESATAELDRYRSDQEQNQLELKRLAYSRKKEVDPNDYENFRRGIRDLTRTERQIFEYYLQGKTVKEITELMGVKESTIRFHNRNIYMTLGVNSLKQLLLCAAILNQEEKQ